MASERCGFELETTGGEVLFERDIDWRCLVVSEVEALES